MAVEHITDREELRAFLMKDRLANAYLLGNLDPAYFQFCKWYGLRDEHAELQSLALLVQVEDEKGSKVEFGREEATEVVPRLGFGLMASRR